MTRYKVIPSKLSLIGLPLCLQLFGERVVDVPNRSFGGIKRRAVIHIELYTLLNPARKIRLRMRTSTLKFVEEHPSRLVESMYDLGIKRTHVRKEHPPKRDYIPRMLLCIQECGIRLEPSVNKERPLTPELTNEVVA